MPGPPAEGPQFRGRRDPRGPEVEVEVFEAQAVLIAQLGHPLFEVHQGLPDLFHLRVAEVSLFHPADRLPFHQLPQELHHGEYQRDQVAAHLFTVEVESALARTASFRHSGPESDHGAGTRSLTDDSSACRESRTSGTSAMAMTRSPLMTTPVDSTRSRRSTNGTPMGPVSGPGVSQGTGCGADTAHTSPTKEYGTQGPDTSTSAPVP